MSADLIELVQRLGQRRCPQAKPAVKVRVSVAHVRRKRKLFFQQQRLSSSRSPQVALPFAGMTNQYDREPG